MAKVVVTGGAGFIGGHTVEELVRRGYDVVTVDRRSFSWPLSGAKSVTCDIAEKGSLDGMIGQDDKVLHLAAIARFEEAAQHPHEAVRTNVLGTMNVIRACIKRGAERLVFSSTGSVYSPNVPVPTSEVAPREPMTLYGLTKKGAEDLIFFYGGKLPFIILRYGYVYGQRKEHGAIGAFVKAIREGKSPTIYGGHQTNDFIHVKDVVEANLLALESPHLNQAYNIGSGVPVSIEEVCNSCIRAMNAKVGPVIKPPRGFDFRAFVYDISKAKSMLGFTPRWGLEDGIRDTLGE